MAHVITKNRSVQGRNDGGRWKILLKQATAPLKSFNRTQHLPYGNLHSADQEDLLGFVWVYQDCLILFDTFPPLSCDLQLLKYCRDRCSTSGENGRE